MSEQPGKTHETTQGQDAEDGVPVQGDGTQYGSQTPGADSAADDQEE